MSFDENYLTNNLKLFFVENNLTISNFSTFHSEAAAATAALSPKKKFHFKNYYFMIYT